MTTTARRICPLCEATCGLVLELDGDTIVGVRGDDDHVLSRGYVCPKGAALRELDHDPDRLTTPRIRDGDTWRDVTWDEAFAHVDAHLRPILDTHGRDAVALYQGNPNVHTLAGQLYGRVLRQALGTRNVATASTVDQMPKHRSCAELFGDPLAIPVPDIDRTDLLVAFGANPLMSNGSLWTVPDVGRRIRDLQARGGQLMVIDPRRSRTAAKADQHVAIRPGTDALLLAGMVRTLFDEGLVDLGDLADHVDGVEEVDHALAGFDADVVAPACGVDADVVRDLARAVAKADRAVVYGRIGTTTTTVGTLASWLVDVCNVLTGNLDRAGGAMFPNPAHEDRTGRPPTRFGRWRSRVSGHPEVLGELPAAALAEEMTTPGEGQVRAFVCVAGNPVLSTPDGGALDAALAELDFMVAVDPYVTATSRRADVILPPPASRYRAHYDLAFAALAIRDAAVYTRAPLPLPDDAMAEEDILLRLAAIAQGAGPDVPAADADDLVAHRLASQLASRPAARTGERTAEDLLAAVAPRRGPERLLDLMLRSGPYGDGFGDAPDGLSMAAVEAAPSGIDLGALEPRIPDVLTTASGRVELAPAAIMADVARLVALRDAQSDGPLLVGRRHLRTNNSWMHNLPHLRGTRDLCTLQVHPDDAIAWGLSDGGHALVSTDDGAVTVPVEVTDDIRPGVVSLPHGFGHDLDGIELDVAGDRPGANVNLLMSSTTLDPLSGTAALTAVPVSVTAA
ncbi:molybdopterin-dependent oxidoreductase [Salsipaludibacter albus]|uniref:molybdopterin-dependent oxidoreductase n=1 Tax=Salsipaludibacter albus TaxID=2849650 RepID=UPI001EE4A94F|nr:molybdopterin-dependent oxidoreductase [Salsipaludibacter albus]